MSKTYKNVTKPEVIIPEGLITSAELCAILGFNKTMLTKMRKAGLISPLEVPYRNGKPTAYWNLEHVEAWIADNWKPNWIEPKVSKIEDMYARLCDAEKISYNAYAALINNNGSEVQIIKARKEWTEVIKSLRSIKLPEKIKRRRNKEFNKEDILEILQEIIIESKSPSERLDAIKTYANIKLWKEQGLQDVKNDQTEGYIPKNDELFVTFDKDVNTTTTTTLSPNNTTTTTTTTNLPDSLEIEL